MRKVTAIESITLDGVMQAPGRPDEDTRGGFEHGGWGIPFADEVMGRAMGERMAKAEGGLLVLGRRTYEDLFEFWPKQKDNPYTEALNRAEKHVASTTLKEPLPWQNSRLLEGDAVEAVAKLKREPGRDVGIIGSGELVRSLIPRDLIDEYLLLIHPLVLGSGQRLFPDGAVARLALVDSVTTTTGVVIGTYRRTAGVSDV
ncbi:MAG: dihydrofolate reductase family protein [Solirubrobacterales bacterium]